MLSRMQESHWLATLTDVANLAGVSTSTASRALSGSRPVAKRTLERVEAAVKELGYRPSALARSLRNSRSHAIGVVLPEIRSETVVGMLQGLGDVCQERGYQLLVTNSRLKHEVYLSLVRELFDRRVDGLVLATPMNLEGALDEYKRAGVPTLAMITKDESCADVPLVTVDERLAMKEALGRLVALGHTSIAYVLGSRDDYRIEHLERYLRSSGLSVIGYRIPFGQDREERISSAVRSILTASPRPTATFVSVLTIPAFLSALADAEVHIPRQMSVISFGEASWYAAIRPSVSTISFGDELMGRAVGASLLDWIDGSHPVPVSLQLADWEERESVAPVQSLARQSRPRDTVAITPDSIGVGS
jgi:LacI family transcriptional regulator